MAKDGPKAQAGFKELPVIEPITKFPKAADPPIKKPFTTTCFLLLTAVTHTVNTNMKVYINSSRNPIVGVDSGFNFV